MKMDIVSFAYQIIEMEDKIAALSLENERLREYEKDYHKLVDSSYEHNAIMLNNVMQLCLTPGVIEACKKHKTFGVQE